MDRRKKMQEKEGHLDQGSFYHLHSFVMMQLVNEGQGLSAVPNIQ